MLDAFAEQQHSSRSDLVERIVNAVTSEDLGKILVAEIPQAPSVKLNLRLSPEALAHLKQLAGDMPPADFLRQVFACVAEDEDTPGTVTQAQQEPAHGRSRRREPADVVEPDLVGVQRTPGIVVPLAAVVFIAVLALLVGFLVGWFFSRRATSPPARIPEPRGQLPTTDIPQGTS